MTGKQERLKSYYAPIIPTLINAYARLYMYDQFKKIPETDLIYTDTDSIIMKQGHLDKFTITEHIGEFKVEQENETVIVKGRKTYAIGDEIKVSGFRKADVTMEDFRNGIISSKRMETLKTTDDLTKVGSFVTEKRDLNVQEKEALGLMELYKNEKVFKDQDITNIDFFAKHLAELKI